MNTKEEAKRLLLDKQCNNCYFGVISTAPNKISCNFSNTTKLLNDYCDNYLKISILNELFHASINGPFNPKNIIKT
jgi:hypothetical protein